MIEEMERQWGREREYMAARALKLRQGLETIREISGCAMDLGDNNEAVRKCYVASVEALHGGGLNG